MIATPKFARPLLGPSVGSAAVALATVGSLIAYLLHSKAVTLMIKGWGYLDSLIRALLKAPQGRALAFGFSPSPIAVVTLLIFLASCVTVGVLVARGMRGHRGAMPMAVVGTLAATVVPTLVVAVLRWPDGGGSITSATICIAQLLLVAGTWFWSRRQTSAADAPSATVAPLADDAMSKWLWLLVALAVCYALTILLSGFSGIFGYDSYSDHIARPARWLYTGRLEHGLPDEIVLFYPGNFELLVRWTLSLGTDRLAFLTSFASSVAAVWVVFRIALEIGQSRTAAAMSALGAASLQVLAYQSMVVYSDSYTALCLLLATWLLLVLLRDGCRDVRLTVGFAVALGLALGAKYSAGPPVVILGLVWLFYSFKESFQFDADGIDHPNWSLVFRRMLILSVSVLPVMAYWYVRNAIEQHNPLYPLSVGGLPGINLDVLIANAPGPKSTYDRLTYAWTEIGHGIGYETGLGPLFASVAVIGVLVLPVIRARPGSQSRLLWLILLGAFIAWWRTGVLVPRYGLFPILLSFVFVGELWSAYASRLLALVYGLAVSATMITVGHEMLGGVAYSEFMFDPVRPVPAVINTLPPSRILNASGQPSGYYAMGVDARHKVINLFRAVTPDDVHGLAPDYLLIPQSREPEFAPLGLELMGRWEKQGQPSTSLWRVTPAPKAP